MCVKYNDSRILRLRRFKNQNKILDAINLEYNRKQEMSTLKKWKINRKHF